jgi:hypothetical protein
MKNTLGYPLEEEGSHIWLPYRRGRVNRSSRFIVDFILQQNRACVNWNPRDFSGYFKA